VAHRGRLVAVGGGVARRPRRATQWLGPADFSAIKVLGAASAVLDQSFAFAEDATIVRTRGSLWVRTDQVGANEAPFGALGFAVVRDEAAAIGITAIPTPIANADVDAWFVWQPFVQGFNFFSSVGANFDAMTRYDFDSKAQRKVNDSDTVVVVIDNNAAGHGMQYMILFRMLIMLHG